MEDVPLKSDTVRPLDAGARRDVRDSRSAVEAALAREMRIGKALREVGLALGTTLDLDQLLELILEKITEARRGRSRDALPPRRARTTSSSRASCRATRCARFA